MKRKACQLALSVSPEESRGSLTLSWVSQSCQTDFSGLGYVGHEPETSSFYRWHIYLCDFVLNNLGQHLREVKERHSLGAPPPAETYTILSILTNSAAWSTVALFCYYHRHPCKLSSCKTGTLCQLNNNTPCPPYPPQPSFNFLSLWFDYS